MRVILGDGSMRQREDSECVEPVATDKSRLESSNRVDLDRAGMTNGGGCSCKKQAPKEPPPQINVPADSDVSWSDLGPSVDAVTGELQYLCSCLVGYDIQ